ncbi:MAG TPA: hypothetical protein VEC99_08340 [Clostridia bacterium]|nr:hypothetical protein [Clostridia bacterium]
MAVEVSGSFALVSTPIPRQASRFTDFTDQITVMAITCPEPPRMRGCRRESHRNCRTNLCAETEAERERVREVVRDLTDHLLANGLVLIDHDGKPTRWAIYGPQHLNRDPFWWSDRGLKSLSILSYLAVAEHVTGDNKYRAAANDLIEQHGYAHNAIPFLTLPTLLTT